MTGITISPLGLASDEVPPEQSLQSPTSDDASSPDAIWYLRALPQRGVNYRWYAQSLETVMRL